MTDYLTEQEQVELLKSWIKQYSLVILAGVLIAVAAMTGWRYWQDRQNRIMTHASAIYDNLLNARAQGDNTATLAAANKLVHDYASTPYSQIASLMLARDAIIHQHYPEAEQRLHWVINKSSIKPIRQIARIRLARVLITENKPEEAIAILKKINDKNFNGLTDEVRGDAYLAMKNTEMARQSYKQALDELPNVDVIRPLLRMKYDNLATA